MGTERDESKGRTRPSDETRAAERKEAARAHDAGGIDEAAEADAPTDVDPDVVRHEREMAERGAHQKGEGRV